MKNKSATAYRSISEVADMIGVKPHVLRFWEKKFVQIKPLKRDSGRRYYRPEDVKIIAQIKDLLHHQGYTVRGVQQLFKQKGVKVFQLRDETLEFGTMNVDAHDASPAYQNDADDTIASHAHNALIANPAPAITALQPEMKEKLLKLYGEIGQYLQQSQAKAK